MKAKISSKEQIAAHLSEHQKSGLSAAKYAALNGLVASSFYNWRAKYCNEKTAKPKQSISSFVKVKICEPVSKPEICKGAENICLRLNSGQLLEFPSSVTPDYLAKFVRALN